jgi:phosphoglycolate phosphatase-like HAD superfamily hydrolase
VGDRSTLEEIMIDVSIHGKTVKGIELIIFDKDGTLFELYPYWTVVANRRSKNICKAIYRNKPVVDLDLVEQISTLMGVNNRKQRMDYNSAIGRLNRKEIQKLIFVYLEGRGIPVTPAMIEDAFVETDRYIAGNDDILMKSLVPVKGIMEFLPSVASGSKCAIFSYDQTSNLERITRIMNMGAFFSTLMGGDRIRYPKPSPLCVIKIMNSLKVLPENTMLIGDSVNDIYSGRDAGCKCLVAVKSDISDMDLISPVAHFVIDDYTEIRVKK